MAYRRRIKSRRPTRRRSSKRRVPRFQHRGRVGTRL